MYHDSSSLPFFEKQAVIKLNANPDDPTNVASAGIVVANEPQHEPAVPMEEAGPGPARTPGLAATPKGATR